MSSGGSDETSHLLQAGSVIEQLVIANQRASVAQQHIQSQRKYYESKIVRMMDG